MRKKLPLVSGEQAVSAFEKAGWAVKRRSGSHIILKKPGVIYNLSIPTSSQLKRGTLRSLIGKAGLSVEDFLKLLS
jgi:predicted RNA binding protein YcfA (HicA-like mRNA interferase family)